MTIKYKDILTLSDKNKYVVASIVSYENSKYAYLVDINNNANLKIGEIENNNTLSVLDSVIDKDLIERLVLLFYKDNLTKTGK